jgi:hypothetical protein
MYGYLVMEVETLTSIFVLIVRIEPLPFSMTLIIPFSFPEIAFRPGEPSMTKN